MFKEVCIVCSTKMKPGLTSWHKVCPCCDYESADLTPNINTSVAHASIDEGGRESALFTLRKSNFSILAKALAKLKPSQSTLLDVGCAHGWFLEATKPHFLVSGIEPDSAIANYACSKKLPVLEGYFPDALSLPQKFDVISFNDVLEHLPNLNDTMNACRAHLNKNGLLLVNLPDTDGIFYRISKALFHLGIQGPFFRMWQKDLPSPHLHYFNQKNLRKFLTMNGFDVLESGHLPSLTASGLWSRINYTSNGSYLGKLITLLSVLIILPWLRFLPKDIHFQIAQIK